MLMRRDDFMKLGGFDPAFFMYGEDVDLCLRALKIGGSPAITPRALVIHDEGASQDWPQREAQLLAARIRCAYIHLPYLNSIIAVWAIRLGVVFRLVAFRILANALGFQAKYSGLVQVWRARTIWWHGYLDPPR